MPPQPAWQAVSEARDFTIQPNSCHGAEIVFRLMWRGRLAYPGWTDDSQINGANIVSPITEPPPCSQRVAHAAQAKRTGKVIPAAGWDNQYRKAKPDQLTQVPMNGAIAAEKQNHVRLARGRGHSDAPVNARIGLERFEILGRTSQSEGGSGAHVRA